MGGWEVVVGGCSCRKGGLEVQWVGGGGRGLFL